MKCQVDIPGIFKDSHVLVVLVVLIVQVVQGAEERLATQHHLETKNI